MNTFTPISSLRLFVPNLDCPSATQRHDFQLGKGPCGRHVYSLQVRISDAGLHVTQFSRSQADTDDVELAEFFYPHHLLRGQVKWVQRLAPE